MAKQFRKKIATGRGSVKVSVGNGSIWLQMDDADGDFEALQSLSKETSVELANALLSASVASAK